MLRYCDRHALAIVFLPVRRRLVLSAPVECPYNENIDEEAYSKQQKEEDDKPREGRHLGSLLRCGIGFLDEVRHDASAAAMFDHVAIDDRCDGNDRD